MPIYEFACEKCHLEFEKLFRSSSNNGHVVCPGCGSKRTRKIFSSFAVSSSVSDGLSDCSSCPNSNCASRKE